MEKRNFCDMLLIEPFEIEEKRLYPSAVPYPVIDQKKTAEQIGRHMERMGLKPKELQKYLGLSCVQTVYRWLEGKNIPVIDHLYALSYLFGVSIDDLVAGTKKECKNRKIGPKLRRMLAYRTNY